MSTTKYPNQILPFGQDSTVDRGDLLSLADYTNDRQRLIGHQPGMARRKLANTQARQGSHMAAGLAQFVANRFVDGVLDDGDLDKVELGLATAVSQNMLWLPLLDYALPSLVFGPDMRIYVARKPSGPRTYAEGVLVGAKLPGAEGSEAYWLDYAKSIMPPPASPYEVGQYYPFQDERPRPGMVPVRGLHVDGISRYPDMIKYLQDPYGQKRVVTKAEYDARHVAVWHTNADGSKVGWAGEGGVNVFVWDKSADSLLVPDLSGMTWEQASAALGVGGVHGDAIRNFASSASDVTFNSTATFTGAFDGTVLSYEGAGVGAGEAHYMLRFDPHRATPTAAKNQPRAWGALSCVFLGIPTS